MEIRGALADGLQNAAQTLKTHKFSLCKYVKPGPQEIPTYCERIVQQHHVTKRIHECCLQSADSVRLAREHGVCNGRELRPVNLPRIFAVFGGTALRKQSRPWKRTAAVTSNRYNRINGAQ